MIPSVRCLAAALASLVILACDDGGPIEPGAPKSLRIVSGDAQQGTVVADLALPLVVRVVDAGGRSVPGIPIIFEVAEFHATPSAGTVVSDDQGRAQVVLTLGQHASPFHVTARIEDIASIDFAVTSVAASPTQVVRIQGDAQHAAPGAVLPVAPTVEVRDAFGNPVPGVNVSFAPTDGSGSVTSAVGVTGIEGRLTVGSWTLGSGRGEHRLVATATGVGEATFVGFAVETSPGITIQVLAPAAAPAVGDELLIRARVNSTFTITAVTARVGATEVPLVFTPGPNEYIGTMSLVGAPRDLLTLLVSAEDVNGAATDGIRQFVHDLPPVLSGVTPLGSSVALGEILIAATCSDDDPAGCTSLIVTHDGAIVAQGTSSINGTFALAGSGSTWLTFRATDSRGQERTTVRRVFVEPAHSLQEIASAPGVVFDHRDGRLLFIDSTLTPVGPVLRTLPSTDEVVPITGYQLLHGFVVPGGAMVVGWNGDYRVHHWKNGSMTVSGPSSPELPVAGNWALLRDNGLVLRDLVNGADAPLPANAATSGAGLAANGDVVYWIGTDLDIFRFRAGNATRITDDDEQVTWNRGARTDGDIIVYMQQVTASPTLYRIMMWDDGADGELAPARTKETVPDLDYAVNAGWTAFTRVDASSRLQVWTRSPAGTLRQVSFLGADARIDALGPDGSVVFHGALQRYHASPAGAPTNIMSSQGTVRWQDTRFIVLLGRSVFAIE